MTLPVSDFPAIESALNWLSQHVENKKQIVIAYSAGMDSTVLLHALSQDGRFKHRILAHYINHGLQPAHTDEWIHVATTNCQNYNVPFQVSHIKIEKHSRKGVESVARDKRYQSLLASCHDDSCLLTGHHQRDQAETVLINLCRGAGVNGLSAMRKIRTLVTEAGAEVRLFRPLLAVPYEVLQRYAEQFELSFITDPSNALTIYRRNAIRHDVLPVLEQHWPAVDDVISRSASHCEEAQLLLDDYAVQCLEERFGYALSSVIGRETPFFDLSVFADLNWRSIKNCIRYWFWYRFRVILSHKHYCWLYDVYVKEGRGVNSNYSYRLQEGSLRIYRNCLFYLKNEGVSDFRFSLSEFNALAGQKDGRGNQESLWWVDSKRMSAMSEPYHGIEVTAIRPDDELNKHAIKRFYQQKGVPVWERKAWPVLRLNDKLVGILGARSALSLSDDDGSKVVLFDGAVPVSQLARMKLAGLLPGSWQN